ncbi:hypothetical protein JCM3774_004245 [Rhodotorula dairenensis]
MPRMATRSRTKRDIPVKTDHFDARQSAEPRSKDAVTVGKHPWNSIDRSEQKADPRTPSRQTSIIRAATSDGTVDDVAANWDDCCTSLAEGAAYHPNHSGGDDAGGLRRFETREILLCDYHDELIDRLEMSELLDLLHDCLDAFDLTLSERSALFLQLASIDAALASVSLYTPPSTPVKKRTDAKKKTKETAVKSKFPVLESAEVPPIPVRPMGDLTVAATVVRAADTPLPKSTPNHRFAWTDRRFTKSKAAAASAFVAGSPADIGAVYLPAHIAESPVAMDSVCVTYSD